MEFPLLPYPFSFLVPWIVHGQRFMFSGYPLRAPPLRLSSPQARGKASTCIVSLICASIVYASAHAIARANMLSVCVSPVCT